MIIQSERVWIGGQFLPVQIQMQDGKITDIRPLNRTAGGKDYGKQRILPGFIDIHTHGAYGFDTNDGAPEGLRDWMRRIPSFSEFFLLRTVSVLAGISPCIRQRSTIFRSPSKLV